MSFQPVIVGSGLVGWQFLKATGIAQQSAFEKSPSLLRDTDYFEKNIGQIKSAEQLVSDRRLLRVALGAFGLQDDINNTFFIQKVLSDGSTSPDALANRLTDDRYKSLAKAFSFDNPFGSRTQLSYFGTEITSLFKAQEFEIAVGTQDESLRLAMNLERALPQIAEGDGSDDAKWFRVMGNPPIRSVIETALALPNSFGRLDLDQQLEGFRDKMKSRFGVTEVADIAQPETMKKVVQGFLLQKQVQQMIASGPNQTALTLISSIPRQKPFG